MEAALVWVDGGRGQRAGGHSRCSRLARLNPGLEERAGRRVLLSAPPDGLKLNHALTPPFELIVFLQVRHKPDSKAAEPAPNVEAKGPRIRAKPRSHVSSGTKGCRAAPSLRVHAKLWDTTVGQSPAVGPHFSVGFTAGKA